MQRALERTLGLRDFIVIVVGAVIGSGIFIVPATVLRQTGGDASLAMLAWVLGGVLSLLGALTYAELGAQRPDAGGLYVFLRDAFGRFPAFLYGWTLFLVIGSGAIATLAAAFSGYLGQLIALSPFTARATSIAMIVVITAINVAGTRGSARVQTWTTALKVFTLVVMSLALVAAGGAPETLPSPPTPAQPSVLAGAGIAMIGVLWAYEGWQFSTFSAGEALNPQRTVPWGITIGTIVLMLLYCSANAGYLAVLGADAAARSEGIAAEAVATAFGPAAGRFVAAAILVSIFSAANAIVLTTPRVFYAMARDGLFFDRLAEVNARTGTPALAIVVTSLWAAVLAATGTFEQLLTYVVFTGWIFYALGAASIFVLRRTRPDSPRPFRVPAYPVTPLLFVLAASAIVTNAVVTQTGRALIGICVVFAGAPAYAIWRARRPHAPVVAAREPGG